MIEIEIEVDPADFGCQAARVVSICVAEGQQVKRGETLIEFECDKASFEVSMPADGTVRHFLLQEGNKVTKTMTVASILTEQTEARIEDSEVVDQKLNLIKARYGYVTRRRLSDQPSRPWRLAYKLGKRQLKMRWSSGGCGENPMRKQYPTTHS